MISSILAIGQNGEIGYQGELPWRGMFAEDKEYYLQHTYRNIRVGARGSVNSFEHSRLCYLVSSKPSPKPDYCEDIFDYNKFTPLDILSTIQKNHPLLNVYVVGGVPWYHASAPYVDKIYLTRFDESFEHDRKVDLNILLDNKKLENSVQGKDKRITFETWVPNLIKL